MAAHLGDYEKYGYKSRGRLNIPRIFPMKKQNLIFLNGNKINLGDKLFALLMRFAILGEGGLYPGQDAGSPEGDETT